ncbi:MAG: hypothetical protein U5L96_22215 [Owenweeksia sp.]|nr:hypothetical protein [Owenweeksia sp.]
MKQMLPIKQIVTRLSHSLSEPPKPNLRLPGAKPMAHRLIRNTALQTSSISAALAIPGGVTGLVTVLPEVASIWRLQAQLISNIAALHGKNSLVTREQMLWCMFRQMGYGVLKEYVIQQGGVYVVKKMQGQALDIFLHKIGLSLATRQGSRLAGKIIPVVGSVSAGALSYYDTRKVGQNALQLYSKEIRLLEGEHSSPKAR